MYIKRGIESTVISMAECFPVVMVCGPRQVGKTTMLRKLLPKLYPNLTYVSFDDPRVRNNARQDPELFLQRYKAPLLIDEFQYVTEILPYIKMRVDESTENGMYFLTGSQMFSMMKNVSESLAGRVGVLSMFSLSYGELAGDDTITPFLPSMDYERFSRRKQRDITQVFEAIYNGSMPRKITNDKMSLEQFYGSYLQTYLDRDIRDLVNVKNESKFIKFLECAAARAGQEMVLSELALDVEIDSKTISAWISILESTGIIYFLQPYYNNVLKRVVKHPKMYFMDTGLVCYLTSWNNPQALAASAMAGAMLENYVVTEIIKGYANAGKNPKKYLYYYRDTLQKEIDLIIAQNNTLYPVEIKKSSAPGIKAIKNFGVLEKSSSGIGTGAVICLTKEAYPLNSDTIAIPVDNI